MYLMEARNLLDTQVFNGRQKKPFFLWIFESFVSFLSHFYTYFELKSIRCSARFCRKKDSQFDRKKVRGYEGRKGMTFCMLCH